jgi:thiamine-phosphate pyrophosphorylase
MLPREKSNPQLSDLIDYISRAVAAGIDMIQIRERDLSARDLLSVTDAACSIANVTDSLIFVNDRSDVAACAGAGVHLTTRSIAPDVARRSFGPSMLIGVSTHSVEEAEAAEEKGAHFVVFGPVFETESKKVYGPPVGVAALGEVAARVKIPVLAIGGINLSNFREALDRGAAGIAAISLFAGATDLKSVVRAIKTSSL